MKASSPFGFAYIFHMQGPAFRDLIVPKVHTMSIKEERETVQIVTHPTNERRLAEFATVVFELWTGEVYKSRNTKTRDLEIILASDETLTNIDLQWCFGAVRFEAERLLEWKLDEAHALQRKCAQLGYKLPEPPDSRVRNAPSEPNLLKVLLLEAISYIAVNQLIYNTLAHAAPHETIKDLGAIVRNARNSLPVTGTATNCKEPL
ncbi:hypothetical protein D3C85_555680 [compost metagenome]